MEDIVKGCLRIIHEAPEREEAYSHEILQKIAYHEAGHTVLAEVLEPNSVNFVSVRSHDGNVGGFTNYYQPEEYWWSKRYMENRVVVILGGKAATEICFGETDVGVRSDMRRAFDIVERFVSDYCSNGFDSWLQTAYPANSMTEKQYTQMAFEMEKFYQKAKKVLIDNREFLDKLATALMNKDILTNVEIQEIKATCKMLA